MTLLGVPHSHAENIRAPSVSKHEGDTSAENKGTSPSREALSPSVQNGSRGVLSPVISSVCTNQPADFLSIDLVCWHCDNCSTPIPTPRDWLATKPLVIANLQQDPIYCTIHTEGVLEWVRIGLIRDRDSWGQIRQAVPKLYPRRCRWVQAEFLGWTVKWYARSFHNFLHPPELGDVILGIPQSAEPVLGIFTTLHATCSLFGWEGLFWAGSTVNLPGTSQSFLPTSS